VLNFIIKQVKNTYYGGSKMFYFKIKIVLYHFINIPLYFLSIPVIILTRIISPFYIIRFGKLNSSRIGHFAANTELYLCEQKIGINKPTKPYIDIFYYTDYPACNTYLAKKWKKILFVWPKIIIYPLIFVNRLIPGWKNHLVGPNAQSDRDINNLLEKVPPHLSFTDQEELEGKLRLMEMGIPQNSKFVCLLVRDSAYLSSYKKNVNWDYHNFRDCEINNYYLAAESLTKKGYYVIRMGTKVKNAFNTQQNKMIIDYATNGMYSPFMDIYLGAKCTFCISTSSGWDAIPYIFRKPIVFAPIVPIGYFFTFYKNLMAITKHHFDIITGKELSLREVNDRGASYCKTTKDYTDRQIYLKENTPEEIRQVVCEFEKRLSGNYISDDKEEELQNKFWNLFPVKSIDENGIPLHGHINARFGSDFLKLNTNWLS
jgi:putative glycosyltransferase (TIGR04372 family)